MTLHQYHIHTDVQKISQGHTEGFKVEYEDGYETWCPKDVFERIATNELTEKSNAFWKRYWAQRDKAHI